MGTISELTQLFATGFGSFFLIVLLIYELYAPRILDKDTALAPIVEDVPQQVEELNERQIKLEDDVDNLDQRVCEVRDKQDTLTDITIAQSRMMNGYEGNMDIHTVEEELSDPDENKPDDYLKDE